MPFIRKVCPECEKVKEVTCTSDLGDEKVFSFICGHFLTERIIEQSSPIDSSPTLDGKTLYPFQEIGVRFALQSNVRCLFADEMGLGKTIEALRTITSRKKELAPFAVFCKSSVKLNWLREIWKWCGKDYLVQIVENGKTEIEPGHDAYIFSLDLLRRLDGKHALGDTLGKANVKTIIIDECQLIKNPDSQRARVVRATTKNIPHVMGLSGTPIKNRAPEYFSILNILRPEMFPVYQRFIYNECDFYNDRYGRPKIGGLRYPKEFLEKTKDFIIRRTREEVMPELPKVNRTHHYTDLGEEVSGAYEREMKDFLADYDASSDGERASFTGTSNTLAHMSRMRHLTGLAKIDSCLDKLSEFLGSSERKVVLYVHHKDVHQILLSKVNTILRELELEEALSLVSELDSTRRDEIIQEFQNLTNKRVLVASTLAFGEGINLQSCADCILVERQWNPANEEQAESRFIRIGQMASQVNAIYLVALGTIDEYFAELVEKKRSIFKQVMDGQDYKWTESEIMRELAEILATKGRREWQK